jgi:hypothetical protein
MPLRDHLRPKQLGQAGHIRHGARGGDERSRVLFCIQQSFHYLKIEPLSSHIEPNWPYPAISKQIDGLGTTALRQAQGERMLSYCSGG